MRRWMLMAAMAATAALVPGTPAAAGGWWSSVHLDGSDVKLGETLTAHSEAFFTTVAQAEAARSEPFYAYLVRGHDAALLRASLEQAAPQRWWRLTQGSEVVRVGTLTFGNWSANLGEARARITIPARIDTGRWQLMFCDTGCRNPMGSVIPTPVLVRPAAGEAQREVAQARRALDGAQATASTRLWEALVAGTLLGALGAVAVLWRRSRHRARGRAATNAEPHQEGRRLPVGAGK